MGRSLCSVSPDVELIIVSSGEHIPEVSPLPRVALSIVSGLSLGPSPLPLSPWWVSWTVSHTAPHPARSIIPPQFGGGDLNSEAISLIPFHPFCVSLVFLKHKLDHVPPLLKSLRESSQTLEGPLIRNIGPSMTRPQYSPFLSRSQQSLLISYHPVILSRPEVLDMNLDLPTSCSSIPHLPNCLCPLASILELFLCAVTFPQNPQNPVLISTLLCHLVPSL